MMMERRRREAAGAFLPPAGEGNAAAATEETADQRLDRLILEEQQRNETAVRSMRISIADGAVGGSQAVGDGTQGMVAAQADGVATRTEGGQLQLLQGLSPEQQGMLARAAEALRAGQVLQLEDAVRRPDFLPPPLQLGDVPVPAGRHGQADQGQGHGSGQLDGQHGGNLSGAQDRADHGTSGHGGSLLGPLALRPGEVLGADFALRPLDLPPMGQPLALQPLGGHLHGSGQGQQVPGELPPGSGPVQPAVDGAMVTPPRQPAMNVFWSERAQRALDDGVQDGGNGPQPGAGGPPEASQPPALQAEGAQPPALGMEGLTQQAEGAQPPALGMEGLTQQDLKELEVFQTQALRDMENQVQREIARRKGKGNSNGGSGSYGTPQDDGNGNGGRTQPTAVSALLASPPGLQAGAAQACAQVTPGPTTGPVPLGSVQLGGIQPMSLGFGNTPQVMTSSHVGMMQSAAPQNVGVGMYQQSQQNVGAQHPPGSAAAQVGESLSESLRALELPRLGENTTALSLGDWLAVVEPLMSDLSSTSSTWWRMILEAAYSGYHQWILAGPLDRLRLRPQMPTQALLWPRTEQRAVTMLLACIPDELRKDLIATRRLTTVEIVYKLLVTYQPGGPQERTVLLKDITEDRLGTNPSVQDVLSTLRTWRRNVSRANELRVTLPDVLVLVGLMTKWADHISRLGGAQAAFRIATLRQDLRLDNRPDADQVMYFAEALQAEIEQIAVSRPVALHGSSSNSSDSKKKEPPPKAASLRTGDGTNSGQTSQGGEKQKCKFWGSSVGCKRGDRCRYLHSWDGINKNGRCWTCSGEGHMKPNCPYKTPENDGEKSGEKTGKISKVNAGPSKPPGGKRNSGKDAQVQPQPTSSSSTGSTEEKPTKGVEEIPVVPATPVIDVTGLMKSLQSMKAVQLRYMTTTGCDELPQDGRVALLDGGATHALRQGTPEELKGAQPVIVDLAHGRTTLFRRDGCSTLLSKDPIEAILPMRLLVENGYNVRWSANECVIAHPTKGNIRSWRRQGCPVMREDEALLLLEELEEIESENEKSVEGDVKDWWKRHYPEVPDEVLRYMKGQDRCWSDCGGPPLPWNRRKRRQVESSKGVILHLFSGAGAASKKWNDLRKDGYEVLTLDIASNAAENLHNMAVWSYLWSLASRNLLKVIIGGPPCRSFSRLRHKRPGPRPLRSRVNRWCLPNLSPGEFNTVMGDSALILKMLGLYDRAVEVAPEDEERFFLMEHPADPMDYLGDEAKEMPSVWTWEELQSFARRHQLGWVHFDQGRTGHARRKPTTLLTSLHQLQELNGATGGGYETLREDLQGRLEQTASWAEWSPGLVQAIKLALQASLKMMEDRTRIQKMTVEDWRQHCRQGHVPFRRDCRLCVEEMGQDAPHRRRKHKGAGDSVYVMAADVVGPFVKGLDYGMAREAKYALITTVPVPLFSGKADDAPPSEKGEAGDEAPLAVEAPDHDQCQGPAEAQGSDDVPQPAEVPLADQDPLSEEVQGLAEELRSGEGLSMPLDPLVPISERLQADWERQRDAACEPFDIQNITMVEPMASRSAKDLLEALNRVYSRYRALGIPIYRFHSDRAKEFIGKTVRQWIATKTLWQTSTGGDDPKGNGRAESEVLQFKRRLRLNLHLSGAPHTEWPSVARHVAQERMNAQLQKVGLKRPPSLPYNKTVMVKCKWWDKLKTKGIAAPFQEATIKGPSPLLHNGYVVLTKRGSTQHARSVLTMDPEADRAMLELEEHPGKPKYRLTGKQSVSDKLPPPKLHNPADFSPPEPLLIEESTLGGAPLPDLEEDDYSPSELPELPHDDLLEMLDDPTLRSGEDDAVMMDDGIPAVSAGGESSSPSMPSLPSSLPSDVPQGPSISALRAPSTSLSRTMSGTPPTSSNSLTSSPSTLPTSGTTGSMTPGDETCVLKRFEWNVTLEEYDEWLCKEHYGVSTTLNEIATHVPTDGDEGMIQGTLVEEMLNQMHDLENDLRKLNQWISNDQRRQHLEAARLQACTVDNLDTADNLLGRCEMKSMGHPTPVGADANGENVGASTPVDSHMKNDEEKKVLQTYTVPLQEVRANLAKWRPAILSEYESLTKVTKAVRPVHKDTLKNRTDVEYAPGKLVTVVKAPSGRMKARLVVCGNRVEASLDAQQEDQDQTAASEYLNKAKGHENYASGADAATIRAMARKAAQQSWRLASIDVRTAFLLAPRRGKGLLAVKPPSVLIAANICDPNEVWLVDRALYGLQSSPKDWGIFRDDEMKGWSWKSSTGTHFRLEQTRESNLWRIKELLENGHEVTSGHVIVYVDDMLVSGRDETITAYLDHVKGIWECSPPDWTSVDGPAVKFCGFEFSETQEGHLRVSQESYARELVKRYQCTRKRPVPMTQAMAAAIPETKDEELDPKSVRLAQTITGEVLWLALRSRPDLAFVVGVMGRHSTKNPDFVNQLGRDVIEYINGTVDAALVYGPCDLTDRGLDDGLPFPRDMRRLEAYADVSFAPQASRSIQGVMILYGGAPVMWESNRQSCITLSTAEAELLSYVEAMGMADSMGCVLEALEEVPCQLSVVDPPTEETGRCPEKVQGP